MERLLAVLCNEKARLDKKFHSDKAMTDEEKTDCEGRMKTVRSDIDRLEQYIGRPGMQTFSELIFVDDIRLRVKRILDEGNGQ